MLDLVRHNMHSAYEHSEVVHQYLEREASLHRLFPLTAEEAKAEPRIQISAFGVIPKQGQVEKWRLIVELSSPSEHSVNDCISHDLCSISYTSGDEAVTHIQLFGWGPLLAKMDLKECSAGCHFAQWTTPYLLCNGRAQPLYIEPSHSAYHQSCSRQ